MRGNPRFVKILDDYRQKDLLNLLNAYAPFDQLSEAPIPHDVAVVAREHGKAVAKALWQFLRVLPVEVGAKGPVELLLGYEPLNPLTPDSDDDKLVRQWNRWQAELFRLAGDDRLDVGHTDASTECHQTLQRLLYNEMDRVLTTRLPFWLSKPLVWTAA